jgi:hypothetical protein
MLQMEVLQKKLETAKKIEVGAETMLGLEEMQQSVRHSCMTCEHS